MVVASCKPLEKEKPYLSNIDYSKKEAADEHFRHDAGVESDDS
jgi:hypothetical protein